MAETGDRDRSSRPERGGPILLGIDTCGPLGTVALGRVVARDGEGAGQDPELAVLGAREFSGQTCSTQLMPAIADLLREAGLEPAELGGVVVVHGPGSFTGVRLGLSAAKALAEALGRPLAAFSRLRVLAVTARASAAALDAGKGDIFLGLYPKEPTAAQPGSSRELLAGPTELSRPEAMEVVAWGAIAAGDAVSAALLRKFWPDADIVEASAPSAADALRLGAGGFLSNGPFDDAASLDGHYLRRAYAEDQAAGTQPMAMPPGAGTNALTAHTEGQSAQAKERAR